jgi:LacI family transcriptional regulator
MRQADGLVLLPSGPLDAWRETIVELGKTDCPVVLVQVAVPDLGDPVPRITSVRADDFGGGRACGTLLAQLGHRRIAFLTTRASWPAVDSRLDGAGEALSQAGVPPATRILAADWTVADGRDAVVRCLAETSAAERPTAIMAANDVLAAGALAAIREAGLSVPRDISVAGFDDLDLALVVSPTLTTIAVPGYEVGRRAANAMVEHLESSEPIAPPQVLQTRLVLRDSTAPPPA